MKQRAVSKIKALQTQVDTLQQQLNERPPVGPPDESSSDGSEKSAGGFVKVGSPTNKNPAQELQRREAELAEREEALQRREAELAERAATGTGAAWHSALLAGLREVQANCGQVDLAFESAGLA